MSTPPRDFAQWMRTVERKLVQAIRTGNSAAITALNAEAAQIREEIAASGGDARVPAAPVELTVQTSLLVDNNGRTYGKLLIDFPDVTKATDATNLAVDHYELWGRDETGWDGQAGTAPEYKLMDTSELSTFYSAPYEPASTWRFKVRAIGVTTPTPGTYSSAVIVTIEADTTPPPIPSPVVLTQQYSAVTVTWDGLAAAGGGQPADYSHTEVAVAQTSSPTSLHTVFRGADYTVITGLPLDAPTYVRTRSVDYSGNKSGWSAQRQITPKSLVSGDISGLDVTLAEQVARSEAAEGAALQSAADAATAAEEAVAAQNAAVAAQSEADAAAADAALVVADSAAITAEATAARTAAEAAAADAAAAELAATNAQSAADQSFADLQGFLDNSGKIIRQELEPAVEDRTVNNLWIKDSTGEPYTWVLDELLPEGGSWVIVTDQRVVEMSAAADAAADSAESAEAAAAAAEAASVAAQQDAAASAGTAATAQQNAQAASAAANQAQAEADAAAAAATQSAADAAQAVADAEAAAQSAGSSSAAALAAEQSAEAANTAADAAVLQMETAIARGSSLYPDPGFENGYGAFQQVAGKIERVQDRVHLGLWALRYTTDGGAGNLFDYPDKVPVSENSALYVEYWAYADANWPVGGVINTYVDRFPNADGSGSSTGFTTNPTVLVAGAWQKISVYVEVGAYKSFRAFPVIPGAVNSTAGRNVWIDDFRVLDVTNSYFTTKAAQTKANEANALAGQAKGIADSALSASTHAGKAFFSADPPSGTAPLNSTWQQYDEDGDIIGAWQQTAGDATTDGGTWTKRQLTSAQFDNFDAGKITFGTMSGARIEAGTLSVTATVGLEDKIDLYDANGTLLNSWKKTGTTFIDGGQLFTDSVTTLALAANAVEADNIKAGAVIAEKLEASLVLTTKIIAGDPLGTHAVMDQNGFRVFSADPADGIPNEVVRMGVAATDDYFAITKADGSLAATISQDGVGSFTQVNATNSLYYKGTELSEILRRRPKGNVGYHSSAAVVNGINTNTGMGLFDLGFNSEAGRAYRISGYVRGYLSGGNGQITVQLKAAYNGAAPSLSSQSLTVDGHSALDGHWNTYHFEKFVHFNAAGGPDAWARILLVAGREVGPGVFNVYESLMSVDDVGIQFSPTGTPNTGGGTTAPAKTNYVKQYGCYNSYNYNGSNGQYPHDLGHMYQGLSPAGYGNTKSIGLFPDMASDLSGSSINYIRVYFNFLHWYYNSGGTARIGLHGHTGIPGSFSHAGVVVSSGGWPKPGARWVDIPSAYWDGFKSGAYRGISLEGDGGYGTYGYADRPTIEISYTK